MAFDYFEIGPMVSAGGDGMCGRFSLNRIPEELLEVLGLGPQHVQERFNIAPAQEAPVAFLDEAGRPELQAFRWGLVPGWAVDPAAGVRAINARAESIADKPTFKEAFRRRRCLVPASGFYEWQRSSGGKIRTPFYFTPEQSGAALVFAGLWDEWHRGGEVLRSFTIITTEANTDMDQIHDRMPLFLLSERWRSWLDPKTERPILDAMLRPPKAGFLRRYEVSPYVNSVAHEGGQCIEPAEVGLF